MNKLLVLAALLGATLAGEFDFWTEGLPTSKGYLYQRTLVDNPDYFTFKFFLECDFGFGTFYKSIYEPAPAAPPAPTVATIRGHQYGGHIYSYCRMSAISTVFNSYEYIGDVQLEPAYVAPYMQ